MAMTRYFLPREYSTPESISNVKMNFLKVHDSFLELFPDWAERNHWCWIFTDICAKRTGINMYVGNNEKIAVNINSSKATVQEAMDSLCG